MGRILGVERDERSPELFAFTRFFGWVELGGGRSLAWSLL